jgi:alpha-D-ribose 1-methylphosphonate 5-triphosphate synthase subunit PhnH
VSLTLIDQETTLHLDPVMRAASSWLAFHAGARFAGDRGAADFVIASSCPLLSDLQRGTDEAPEQSATLILQIAALGTGAAYRLSGPGLAEPIVFRATGMPDDFVAAWQANHALFPRGIDIILCAGHSVAALPRSIVLEAA